MTGPEPCPRCAEQIAELQARLQFRPCGYTAPGAARCEVRMPGGRLTRGTLCAAHTVLLSASPAFGVTVLDEQEGPCGWLVPAEEAVLSEDTEDGVTAPEEVPA